MTVEPRRVMPVETATVETSQTAAAQLLTRSYCTQHDVAPLAYENGILTIGVIKAAAEERIREVRAITGKRVRVQAMTHDAIRDALAKIYAALDGISFQGMQFRRDIGWRALGVKGHH